MNNTLDEQQVAKFEDIKSYTEKHSKLSIRLFNQFDKVLQKIPNQYLELLANAVNTFSSLAQMNIALINLKENPYLNDLKIELIEEFKEMYFQEALPLIAHSSKDGVDFQIQMTYGFSVFLNMCNDLIFAQFGESDPKPKLYLHFIRFTMNMPEALVGNKSRIYSNLNMQVCARLIAEQNIESILKQYNGIKKLGIPYTLRNIPLINYVNKNLFSIFKSTADHLYAN